MFGVCPLLQILNFMHLLTKSHMKYFWGWGFCRCLRCIAIKPFGLAPSETNGNVMKLMRMKPEGIFSERYFLSSLVPWFSLQKFGWWVRHLSVEALRLSTNPLSNCVCCVLIFMDAFKKNHKSSQLAYIPALSLTSSSCAILQLAESVCWSDSKLVLPWWGRRDELLLAGAIPGRVKWHCTLSCCLFVNKSKDQWNFVVLLWHLVVCCKLGRAILSVNWQN